jgi:deoxyribodipyrimidine photo-lyase
LITEEDCRVEDFDLSAQEIRTRATLASSHLRSPLEVAEAVVRFEAEALADAARRLGGPVQELGAGDPGALARWAVAAGASQIVTPYVTRGPLRDWLDQAAPSLAASGVVLCEWRRAWDAAIWPHASAGFFKVRQQIPRILQETLP